MRIALGQINPTVGDLAGNIALCTRFARDAAARGAELLVFPELCITGYPPRDLVEKRTFIPQSEAALHRLAAATADLPLAIVAGYVGRSQVTTGKQATNSAALIKNGKILFRQTKMLLPTYDVFDEARNFVPGAGQSLLTLDGRSVALTICEDAWNDKGFWPHRLYELDPVDELMKLGGSLLLSINASPFHLGKREMRQDMFRALGRRHNAPVVMVNQVGGNDQVVFDGSSFVMNARGEVIASAASFREDLVIADIETGVGDLRADLPDENDAVYEALVLGTRDYIQKCGFSKVLIGLSGGIDSSLVAVIAVDAVGRENVHGVAMPGPYSSEHSVTDARAMAEKLGIQFDIISITPAYEEMRRTLAPVFAGRPEDVTEENLQARLRGMTLMSLSNKLGALVLTTGNKSEIAVGYCTLYGDMCGGLAVISDVPKTLVYELSRIGSERRRSGGEHAADAEGAIPESVFEKPPSAELRPDQKDSDSLPPYDVLDNILRLYVEEFHSAKEIATELQLSEELVRGVTLKVDRNEYKRQQAAPGLKVTTKAFGIGRRFPIAQRYFENE
ncbi:MAG: NH(3)-dependent synthetase [Bryobacterales bacterium]|nr:NH(3)-dependent synthetase [Bryobacterales bacterium]